MHFWPKIGFEPLTAKCGKNLCDGSDLRNAKHHKKPVSAPLNFNLTNLGSLLQNVHVLNVGNLAQDRILNLDLGFSCEFIPDFAKLQRKLLSGWQTQKLEPRCQSIMLKLIQGQAVKVGEALP